MSYIGQNPVFGDFPYQTLIGNGTASYTLNFNVSNENGLLVFLNGAIQVPGENYTAGGTSLQFADNVPVGTQIFAYGMGLPKSMLSTSAGAIGLNELAAGVYANAAEARSFINDTKVITPKTLADSAGGSNQLLTIPGYKIHPGPPGERLIEQWGAANYNTTAVGNTFPIAFPTQCFGVFVNRTGTGSFGVVVSVTSMTNTGFNLLSNTSSGSFFYYAIGR